MPIFKDLYFIFPGNISPSGIFNGGCWSRECGGNVGWRPLLSDGGLVVDLLVHHAAQEPGIILDWRPPVWDLLDQAPEGHEVLRAAGLAETSQAFLLHPRFSRAQWSPSFWNGRSMERPGTFMDVQQKKGAMVI